MSELMELQTSRRAVLAGGLTSAAAFIVGVRMAAPASAKPGPRPGQLLSFDAIPVTAADDVMLPPGYRYDVIWRWGDPLVPGGPAFALDASNPATDQLLQAGDQHDGMVFFPLGSRRGLLAVNHEATNDVLLFTDGATPWTADKTAKSQAAHGVGIIEVEEVNGRWVVVESDYARRITANTPMNLTGPAAGHPLLQTSVDPAGTSVLGTLNNCAVGQTPWGTFLTCEENFNSYFGTTQPGATPSPHLSRYGFVAAGFNSPFYVTDSRFDWALEPNEGNRFGWVVEIDPFDPASTPKKRTALGRMKHETATITTGRGQRVVAYMGDDERFEYIYKFVGNRNWHTYRTGESPLDDGVLLTAKFNDDGTGEWLPLVHGEGPLTTEAGFADQGDVLVRTRQAADALGATKMDRPEWVAIHPRSDEVFVTLTNNTQRGTAGRPGPDAANPRAVNTFGHIIRMLDDGDPTARTFTWSIFVLAGDTASGTAAGQEDAFGSPDGVWFDPDGRLWIQTDGSQPDGTNNQMLAADPGTGEIRRFLVGPPGCEITGICQTEDQRTMFVNIQHPGEGSATTPATPSAVSNWPDFNPAGRPRSATIVITRDDGGRIGT